MIHDIRLACRLLLKSPAFTLVAVLTLGLGIGANTAIFSFINAFFLKPVAVQRPDELVSLFTVDERNPGFLPTSHLNFIDYEAGNQVFSGMLAATFTGVSTVENGQPAQIFGQVVTGNYFDLLGVRAALGRTFLPEEAKTTGQNPAVVLSYNYWRTNLGGDPSIIGRSVLLNGVGFTVIGVAPAEFRGLSPLASPNFWVTTASYRIVLTGTFLNFFENNRRALIMQIVGRLKPGVTLEQAEASLKPISEELARQYPAQNRGRSIRLVPFAQSNINPSQRQNFVLAGALLLSLAALVLLITCGNLANLLLARATARQREVAIRLSLGAVRGRLIRQFLTESVMLSLCGGVAGLIIAYWAKDLLWRLRPPFFPSDFQVPLDARVLGFALVVTVVTDLLFGLAPAWTATRPELTSMLKEESKGSVPAPLLSFRNFLVAAQLTLSVVALIVAGLFVRSMRQAQQADVGWNTRNLAVFTVNTAAQGYDQARMRDYLRRAIERVRDLPGVTGVSCSANPLLQGGGALRTMMPQGPDEKLRTQGQLFNYSLIEPGYLSMLGMRFVSGRDFNETDDEHHPFVTIINEAYAKLAWPGEDPVGKTISVFGNQSIVQVVGVVRDAVCNNIGDSPTPFAFFPLRQDFAKGGVLPLHIRTATDVNAQIPALRRELQAMDPAMPFANVTTIEENINQSLWGARTGAALLSVFGLLALLLSSIGVYSIMSYTVGQRTREIGIRMAIGAQASDVMSMILQRGFIVAGTGIAAGVLAAFFVTRLFANLLYSVSANDPLTFVAITGILAVVAAAACFFPARRATRVDPLSALRTD
jgi:predicted permease